MNTAAKLLGFLPALIFVVAYWARPIKTNDFSEENTALPTVYDCYCEQSISTGGRGDCLYCEWVKFGA